MIRRLALVPLLYAAGCSCNESDVEGLVFAPTDPFFANEPEDYGSWLSMDATPDGGRLTIAYYDREQGALGYAVGIPKDDGTVTWVHEAVDGYVGSDGLDRGDRGKYASQATAPDGTVWVAYQDASNGGLYVAHRLGGYTWTEPELVDPGNGAWASLALDAAGNPVVAHQDPEEGVLRLSRYDGAAWTTETIWTGEDWEGIETATGETISREANVGSYVRLVIDGDNELLAFYDAAWQTLSFLEGGPAGYTHTVVDDAGNVGQWPSIWTDGDEVLVAYHDVEKQRLKLATRDGGSWDTEVVDSGEYRGADTEVFKRGDKVAIAYFDGFNNDMMLATEDGDDWDLVKLGGDAGAVGFHNEVVLLNGEYWLGSYDYTSGSLFVTKTN